MEFEIRAHTHLLVIAGSRAYGIHRPDSDVDLKGIAIPPARYYHGVMHHFEQADSPSHLAWAAALLDGEERAAVVGTKLEGAIYELRKFVTLASDANPNILDALFCRDAEIRLMTPLGERLRAARGLFLSAKAKHTFSGYAAAQLKRIRGHRKWLLDPPKAQPTRAEFGLPEQTLLPADQLAAAAAAIRSQVDQWGEPTDLEERARYTDALAEIAGQLGYRSGDDAVFTAAARAIGLDDNLVLVMQREREYEAAARHWRQYEEWRRSRNASRAALEAAHGFDTKHGAHLVRLLKMGREILETGEVHVWRGDRDGDELRAIRAGAWSYDQLLEWAEAEDQSLNELYARGKLAVPRAPDKRAIDALTIELVEAALRAS